MLCFICGEIITVLVRFLPLTNSNRIPLFFLLLGYDGIPPCPHVGRINYEDIKDQLFDVTKWSCEGTPHVATNLV